MSKMGAFVLDMELGYEDEPESWAAQRRAREHSDCLPDSGLQWHQLAGEALSRA